MWENLGHPLKILQSTSRLSFFFYAKTCFYCSLAEFYCSLPRVNVLHGVVEACRLGGVWQCGGSTQTPSGGSGSKTCLPSDREVVYWAKIMAFPIACALLMAKPNRREFQRLHSYSDNVAISHLSAALKIRNDRRAVTSQTHPYQIQIVCMWYNFSTCNRLQNL